MAMAVACRRFFEQSLCVTLVFMVVVRVVVGTEMSVAPKT